MSSHKPLEWYRETYIRDEYKCVYCDTDLKSRFNDWMSIEIDHIVPKSKGGSDDLDNRATSCSACNSFKHSYIPNNFENMSREELIKAIRKKIKIKREMWMERYHEALLEYEQKKKS